MKKITRRSFLSACGTLAAVSAAGTLAACGGSTSTAASTSTATSTPHEPVTIMDASRDYTALMELVHQKYPEITLEIQPYHGRNTTAYMKKQLESDHQPDIYSTTQAWDVELQQEHLLDLSPYAVTELYNPARLNEMDVNGAVYLLPYDFSIVGILCNRSLLERLGLPVPTSFAQLRDEVIPVLQENNVELSACLMNLPGFPFQYFFNIASTSYVNTVQGRQWQLDFTEGDANATDHLQSSRELFQQWIDCGMINYGQQDAGIKDVRTHFMEGNTAFLFGITSPFSQNEDGTGDQYELLPYLSEDGTQDAYITQPSRYYGLSRHLQESGNEQKLEDALHILEVLSTTEGYTAVIGDISSNMCSIKDFSLPEESPYYKAMSALNNGYVAPLVYSGWENYIVPFGHAVMQWICGNSTGDAALAVLDTTKQDFLANGIPYYATVTEELDTAQTAQLCGQIFMSAAGTDAALISYNVYYPEVPAAQENGYGANGCIMEGELTEEDITAFLPTGWYDTLKIATEPGSVLKQMARDGCDMRGNGYPYPYIFLTKDGQPLADDTTYTCVICGYSKSLSDTLDVQDTGIVGLDAAKQYFRSVGEVSTKLLDSSLLQT